jgi:CheY-like chemotaxis protein
MRKAPASKPHSTVHILLVDDNRHGLVARKSLLEELGYCVTLAGNGEEALELLCTQKFDLIVTDYKMPKVDGVELIRRVRGKYPEIRIVDPLGLTEQTTGADAVLAKSAGEVGHLVRTVTRLVQQPPRKPPASHSGNRKSKANSV